MRKSILMKTIGSFVLVMSLVLAINACSKSKTSGDAVSAGVDNTPEQNVANAPEAVPVAKASNDMIEIPFFEIEIELSEAAEKKLQDDNESIIVAAYFTGYPSDVEKVPKEYRELLGWDDSISLVTQTIELTDTPLARFENLAYPKALYDLLDDKDIQLLINVFSGRRSTNRNLLDCGILEGSMSKIEGKRFTISGKLIGE